jgi:hypothetical protein
MKKIFKYKKGLFLFAFFTLLISCNESNDPDLIFEDVPSIRLEKKEKEIRDFLKASEHGWKMLYFTDNSALGGFTFLFNFINDEEVIMDSDFGNPDPSTASLYDVSVGSTLKLTFTTKNVIHELSDGANFPSSEFAGQGYRGSFEFLFSSIEGENIIFRSNRDPSNFITFKRASETDWATLDNHDTVISKMNNDPSKSYFRALKINEKLYNFSYNDNSRFANNSDGESEVNFGIGFTETGIIISPAIDIDGILVDTFEYDESTDKFIAKINGIEVASIFYSDLPSTPFLDYEILPGFLDVNYFFELPPILDSPGFTALVDQYQEENSFLELSRIVILDLDKDTGAIVFVTGFGNAFYNFNKKIENDKLILEFTTTNAPAFTPFLQPLLDIFFSTDGFYVENTGTLRDFSNGTFRFILAEDTSIRFSFFVR